ncbi:DUF4214 domain-containing protein [Cellulomonas sp. GbtcB1]|uniref:DUF4214 domain-containing protein n=1 Tax=Cellulomonas sp. GbtcB1 TaxID=2824746 RepID=UPI001C2F4D54|nr:DUF4214 domain-containing protein [Cellulomonas sp. GbtcB1]
MLFRLLLALSVAATGATVVPPPDASGPGLTDAVVQHAARDAATGTDPGTEVTSTDLVVASAADAQAATAEASEALDAPEPTPSVTPEPSPSASAAPAPDATESGRAALDDLLAPRVTEDEAAAASVDPSAAPVVADALTEDGRVLTPSVATDGVQTLGVTWPTGTDVTDLAPQVRTQTDGTWTGWSVLDVADDGPDEGTADARAEKRGGTDSFWIGDADAVQLSFAATGDGGPADLDLALVGSELVEPTAPTTRSSAASDQAVFSNAVATTSGEGATVLQAAAVPAVITRAQWGARAPVCSPDVAGSIVGAVVHHTAGSNSYGSVAAAMQQIRNDQAYHITGRGWCDIGYNFGVAKWGNIYEGRVDSMTKPVIGVHAGGFNTGTVGVAMLGTYDAAPSAATQDAVGRVIGWRLGVYSRDPQGWMSYATGNGENSRYQNQTVNLPRVFGHRDVSYTACPGNGGYAALGTIRAVAAANLGTPAMPRATAQAVVRALYADLLGRGTDPTGLNTWTTRLMQGTNQADLVAELTRSDEYINKRVAQAYREVLGREPEPAGAANWLAAVRSGIATVDDAQRRFYDSQEYFNRSGGTNAGYVRLLYTTVLGRSATAADVAVWEPRMATAQGRAAVVDGIWFSQEAAKRRAGAYYQVFLQRAPDGPGLQSWANVLLQRGEGAVRTGIAGSQEYQKKALARYPA